MQSVLKIVAILFFIVAGAAIWDAIAHLVALRAAYSTGQKFTEPQFADIARDMAFRWLFAAIYVGIGVGFWQRRRLAYVLVLLFATLIGQWMNVGYVYPFVLAVAALVLLAAPAARAEFRK